MTTVDPEQVAEWSERARRELAQTLGELVEAKRLDADAADELVTEAMGQLDLYALDAWVERHAVLGALICSHPGCFEARKVYDGRGRPSKYCEGAGHTPQTAVRARKGFHRPGEEPAEKAMPSVARASVPTLVGEAKESITSYSEGLSDLVARLENAVRTVGDDEAHVGELEAERARRTAEVAAVLAQLTTAQAQVANAQEAQGVAERLLEEALLANDGLDAELTAVREDAEARVQAAEEGAEERVQATETFADTQVKAVQEEAGGRVAAAEKRLREQAEQHRLEVRAAEEAVADMAARLEGVESDAAERIRAAEEKAWRADEAAKEARTQRDEMAERAMEGEERQRADLAEQRRENQAERERLMDKLGEAHERVTAAEAAVAGLRAELTAAQQHGTTQDAEVARLRKQLDRVEGDADGDDEKPGGTSGKRR